MASSARKRETIAKRNRERAVKEKRALKQEKREARKQAAADARNGEPADVTPTPDMSLGLRPTSADGSDRVIQEDLPDGS